MLEETLATPWSPNHLFLLSVFALIPLVSFLMRWITLLGGVAFRLHMLELAVLPLVHFPPRKAQQTPFSREAGRPRDGERLRRGS